MTESAPVWDMCNSSVLPARQKRTFAAVWEKDLNARFSLEASRENPMTFGCKILNRFTKCEQKMNTTSLFESRLQYITLQIILKQPKNGRTQVA